MSKHDDLIDRAARDLMRGDPSVRLRQMVRARIDRRRAWPTVAAWIPTLAGVGAVVLALFAWWPAVEPPPPQPVAVVTPAPAPATAASQPAPLIETVAATQPQARPRRRLTRPARALDPIAPMVIEPMTTPLMAVGTSSGVMPIEIDDLRIEPLQVQ
jgi:hypothetical protein